ncbi:hypothetical protein [Streptosporangium sp. NPDC000396]
MFRPSRPASSSSSMAVETITKFGIPGVAVGVWVDGQEICVSRRDEH